MHGAASGFSDQIPQCHLEACQDERAKSRCAASSPGREQMLIGTAGNCRYLERISAHTHFASLTEERLHGGPRGGAHALPDPCYSLVGMYQDQDHLSRINDTLCPMKRNLVRDAQRRVRRG